MQITLLYRFITFGAQNGHHFATMYSQVNSFQHQRRDAAAIKATTAIYLRDKTMKVLMKS